MRLKRIIGVLVFSIFLLTNCLPIKSVSASQMTDLMREAYKYLGTPYEWGGNGPSTFDCSGYTSYIYRNALGIDIGRTTYNQVYAGRDVTNGELQPGDLILPSIEHVQIYIGNGMVLHAPQTGDVVRVAKLYNIYSARRIIGESKMEAALFDYKYYADTYADLKAAFGYDYGKLYAHYINYGIREGRKPSAIFDPIYYSNNNNDIKNVYGNDYQAVYDHFVTYGYNENRPTSSEFNINDYRNNHSEVSSMSNLDLYKMIIESRSKIERIMFDYEYYANTYPELYDKYGYDYQKLYNDYISSGINEGKSPSLIFNPKYYLQSNGDVQATWPDNYKEAYNHFVNYGYNENRVSSEECNMVDLRSNHHEYDSMSNLELYELIRDQNRIENIIFDYKYYADTYPELKEKYGYDYKSLYSDYINYGIKEGRSPSIIFNPKYYLEANEDLKSAGIDDYEKAYNQFINSGYKEDRVSSENCDIGVYKLMHSDETNGLDNAEIYKMYKENPEISREYSVEFIDLLGNKIGDTQVVLSGNNAVEPSVPEIEGYKFVKWDKEFNNVTGNLKVYAEYVKVEESSPSFPSEQDKPLIKFDSNNSENNTENKPENDESNNNQNNITSNESQNNNTNTFDNSLGFINVIALTIISGVILNCLKKKSHN